jgi:hypothetical protein
LGSATVKLQGQRLSKVEEIEGGIDKAEIASTDSACSPRSIYSLTRSLLYFEGNIEEIGRRVHAKSGVRPVNLIHQVAPVQLLYTLLQFGGVKYLSFIDPKRPPQESVRKAMITSKFYPANHNGISGINFINGLDCAI